jgi:hypothetical protein
MTKRIRHEPRRFWTAAEMRLVRTYFPWIPTQKIADELCRTILAVYQMATKLGVAQARRGFCRSAPLEVAVRGARPLLV